MHIAHRQHTHCHRWEDHCITGRIRGLTPMSLLWHKLSSSLHWIPSTCVGLTWCFLPSVKTRYRNQFHIWDCVRAERKKLQDSEQKIRHQQSGSWSQRRTWGHKTIRDADTVLKEHRLDIMEKMKGKFVEATSSTSLEARTWLISGL